MYNIKNTDIDREMRRTGIFFRTVLPYFSAGRLRFFSFIMRHFFPKTPHWKGIRTETVYLDRMDGSRLRLLVFRPEKEPAEKPPVVLWFYGGGYAIGSPVLDKLFISRFVHETGSVVVAPVYRHSTTNPYPAADEDGMAALSYICSSPDIDRSRIAIAGQSAGGGMTLKTALRARDEGKIKVNAIFPIFPMIDNNTVPDNDAPVWNTKSDQAAWSLYLKNDDGSYYAVPARCTDWSGLPPLCTYVGTIDPFYNSTITLVENVRKAGGTVALREYEGAFHGFDALTRSTAAKAAVDFFIDTYRKWQRID